MIATNTQTDNFSDLYLPLAYPPYFLSPGIMTLLPDCELHLSIYVRLHHMHKMIHILFNHSVLHYQ